MSKLRCSDLAKVRKKLIFQVKLAHFFPIEFSAMTECSISVLFKLVATSFMKLLTTWYVVGDWGIEF